MIVTELFPKRGICVSGNAGFILSSFTNISKLYFLFQYLWSFECVQHIFVNIDSMDTNYSVWFRFSSQWSYGGKSQNVIHIQVWHWCIIVNDFTQQCGSSDDIWRIFMGTLQWRRPGGCGRLRRSGCGHTSSDYGRRGCNCDHQGGGWVWRGSKWPCDCRSGSAHGLRGHSWCKRRCCDWGLNWLRRGM